MAKSTAKNRKADKKAAIKAKGLLSRARRAAKNTKPKQAEE